MFITEIKVEDIRNIKDFQIKLSSEQKLNLIITGKNGSGKTTLLRELKQYLNNVTNGNLQHYDDQITHLRRFQNEKDRIFSNPKSTEQEKANAEGNIRSQQDWFRQFGGTKILFDNPLAIFNAYQKGEFIAAHFEAKRNTSLKEPSGINKISLKPVYNIDEHAGKEFIQYIVNLKADRSFAKDDNDLDTVTKIDTWFSDFEKSLYILFNNSNIRLKFNRKGYNFNIIENGKEPYSLNQLSDGYSAILSIVTELIMRMEEHKVRNYDVEGIVLVDEIETHLHIDLQKRILPFLTAFFPKVQFIVTTHSPFVLSSISNSVICDLEKKIVTSDLTGYSYDTLIESYFESDKYSNDLKAKIDEYEELKNKNSLPTDSERERILYLKMYLSEIPKFVSDELAVKLQQIRLREIRKKD